MTERDVAAERRKEPVYRCLKRLDEFLHSIATGDWEVDSLHAEVHDACHAYVNLPYPTAIRPAARVPEELRKTMAEVDTERPHKALWACFEWVRSLIASETTDPAPAEGGENV